MREGEEGRRGRNREGRRVREGGWRGRKREVGEMGREVGERWGMWKEGKGARQSTEHVVYMARVQPGLFPPVLPGSAFVVDAYLVRHPVSE